MNNRIYIKRSNVPNKVPTSADIDLGELALNTADVKLYASGTTANSILQIGWDRVSRTGDTLTGDFNINGSITANTFVKSGGTSSQFLKADGSVDSTVYLSGETDTLQSVTTRGSATTTSILANAFIKSGGTNQQFLLADGSVTTASAITVTFTGTTNFLQKLNTSSGLTNSLIYDNGTALGIATTNVTDYTVTIGNQSDRSIGIESNSNGDGKSLTIAGGTGVGTGTGTTFTQIASIFLRSLAFAPNGDVYGSGNGSNVYKQTGGVGAFAIVGSIGGGFSRGCTVAPNGDVYVSRNTGDIYKQTGGIGAFVALGQTSRDWQGMAAAANGDIYCAVSAGDIYKQTGGVGNFIALGQTSRAWQQMCEFNGDIYACGFTQGIFKQTGGVGNFVSIGIQAGRWIAIGTSNGDLYAGSDDNDDLFKQTAGVGAFVPINTGFNAQVAIAGKGTKLYFVDSGSAVVEVNQFINFNGGKLKLEAGAGSGSGTTSIEFNLPIINTGTTQTKSTIMSLANNGDLTLTGRYIKSGGASTEFLKADGSVDNSVYITAYTETDTLQSVTTRGAITTTNITANSFIKSGGLSTQFLKANGSVDSNTYLTTETDTLQSVTNRGATTTTNITANAFIKAGGTSNQFLMADGSVSLGGGGSVSFTGTTNYIQKLDANSAMTNSLIHDNGIGLGIGTTAFTTTATTIQFGNQNNRKISVEPILTGSGKSLVIAAGDTNDTSGTVVPANSEYFSFFQSGNGGWRQMTTAPNGDIYVTEVNGHNVWKKTAAGSSFTPTTTIGQTLVGGITVLANGTVYVATGGGIYTSTDDGSTWNSTAFGTSNFMTMGYDSVTNNVYGAISGGDIYMQTNATGTFNALGQTSRTWRGLLELNGDIYVLDNNGDLYKRTAGVGNFIGQGLTSYLWWDMTTLNGNLYAVDLNGQRIFVRRNNTGDWILTQNTPRFYISISYSNTGELYTDVNDENFYLSPAGSANNNKFDFFAGGLGSVRGMGCGYNGDVYVVGCCGMGGYRMVNNTLPFVQIAGLSTGINWEGIAGAPNGNIWAVTGGNVYKSTDNGAIFNFINSFPSFNVFVAANGDIYLPQYNGGGGIYKSTDNGANFFSLGEPVQQWIGMTELNGDIYACVNGGGIYKQTGGLGSFNSLGQPNRAYFGMASVNGDVYVNVANGDIYIQRNGVGNFEPIGDPNNRAWYGMTQNITTGDLFGSVPADGVYKSINFNNVNEINNSAGGTLTLETGNGNGNSNNSIDFITSTPQTAGTGAQTKTTKMQILGNGNIKMTSIPTFADNASAIAGGLTIGMLYKTSSGVLMIVI